MQNQTEVKVLNLMKWRVLYFVISGIFLVPGVFSLVRWGLKPGIDFTGGSLLELKISPQAVPAPEIEKVVSGEYELESVQKSGESGVIIRGKAIDNQQKEQVLASLETAFPEADFSELRFETVGPTLGAELLRKTLMAVAVVAVLITLYVAYQFKELKYGVCAILAMFHDSLILLGSFSLLGHFYGVEVDILFVTAVLTTLSFSVHDTIVVFDRIRELKKQFGNVEFEQVVNAAVIETLSRSINNSLTIIVMLLALVLLGGDSIRLFAVALLIGSITGTYSSTFTAAPLLLVWESLSHKNKK